MPYSSPTCCQYGRRKFVLVELQVLPDELVDEQVFVGQGRTRLRLILQGAEHFRPDPSLQLAQDPAGLQGLSHGCGAHIREKVGLNNANAKAMDLWYYTHLMKNRGKTRLKPYILNGDTQILFGRVK